MVLWVFGALSPQTLMGNVRAAIYCVAFLSLFWGQAVPAAPLDSAQAEADAAFAVAQRAMVEHAWAEAELNFERVLMFNPDHAEARVQLAILLAQRGKHDAASAFIESLVEDPRTPPAYRQRLQALLAQLQQGQSFLQIPATLVPEGAYVQVRSSWGYSSNPFSRADIDSLTLTLGDANATLPLLQNIRPAPQTLNSLTFVATNRCGFDLADQRWAGEEAYFSNRVMAFCNGLWGQPRSQLFATQRRAIDGSTRTSAGLSLPLGQGRMTLQTYKEPDYERQGFTLRVDQLFTRVAGAGQALVYVEAESANNGAPPYLKYGLWQEWPLSEGLLLTSQFAFQKDLVGYSPLLSNGMARSLTFAEVGLEKHWGQWTGWNISSTVQLARRWSNLTLFEFQDVTLQAHLQRRF
jgi:hypothetical protein